MARQYITDVVTVFAGQDSSSPNVFCSCNEEFSSCHDLGRDGDGFEGGRGVARRVVLGEDGGGVLLLMGGLTACRC